MRSEITLPNPDSLTDDELVARLEAGDVEASLTEIEHRYRARVHCFVRGMVQDEHLAQDVTQEVFEKVFLKSHLYRPGSNFRAWLFEIAKNHALSSLRAKRRTPVPLSNYETDEDHDILANLTARPSDRTAEEHELMSAFQKALAELPEHYQLVFDLCVTRGMEYKQVAQHLNLPLGTVAIRLMRARQRLFRALAPHFDRLRRPPACMQPS